MSGVFNGPVFPRPFERGLLLDVWARDASRMTGIPWSYERIHQRGPLHPCIDTNRLTDGERARLFWCIVAGLEYIRQHNGNST